MKQWRAALATRTARLPWGQPDRGPAWLRIAAVIAVVGAILGVTVYGLAIEESNPFVAFLVVIALSVTALQLSGLGPWISAAFRAYPRIAAAAGVAAAVAFPFTQGGSGYWVRVFASIGVFAVAAIGLNVVVGLAGLLDLGYVAFFGVGAYVGALLAGARVTTVNTQLPFILIILIAAVAAALAGIIIGAPTLRLRGDYLAIVTLGFGEIFRITAFNWVGLTRGPNGIAGVPDLAVGSFDFGDRHELFGVSLAAFSNYYFLEIAMLLVVILVFTRMDQSRVGRAWVAIREDETAAEAMGIDTTRLKLLAFAIGAGMAGVAGAVNVRVTSQVSPDSYTFIESILLVAAVVLGGMGTVPGALLGSTLLFVIPEKLRTFQQSRLLFFGIALILLMRFRPQGLVPSRRRARELRRDDPTEGDGLDAPPGSPVAQVDA
jgi:branched-chain amino acid transport system permease protein